MGERMSPFKTPPHTPPQAAYPSHSLLTDRRKKSANSLKGFWDGCGRYSQIPFVNFTKDVPPMIASIDLPERVTDVGESVDGMADVAVDRL